MIFIYNNAYTQKNQEIRENEISKFTKFITPDTVLNKSKVILGVSAGTALYVGTVYELNQIWYANYPKSKFHFFDDSKEWKGMDKAGHLYTSYFESNLAFSLLHWAGVKEGKSIYYGAALGSLFQATLEVMDGYSEKWGFSSYDIEFNTLGSLVFLTQQLAFHDQYMRLKVSSNPFMQYPTTKNIVSHDGQYFTSLDERANDLFGKSYAETFIKDYNAMTVWASFNISSIFKTNKIIPSWLNLAIGYGADNLYGGFDNSWVYENNIYTLNSSEFPRRNQFYLSFDVDFQKIKTKKPLLKMLYTMLNVIKVPSPTLEINSAGKFKFHPIYF